MSTVFLTVPAAKGARKAGGTAFFVSVDTTVLRHRYLVTAKHNVEGRDDIAVRLGQGETVDVPIRQEAWVHHATADVSVTPLGHPAALLFHASIPIKNAVPEPENEHLMIGSDVFFLGLLRNLPQLADANVPIVRSGTLGLFNQSGIKLKDERTQITSQLPSAHLIDCRAYKGMSGAPCFAQHPDVRVGDGDTAIRLITKTYLLGLISAHFDERIQVDDDDVGGAYPIHTGVAVVTPVRFIRELLMDDNELKEARDKADEAQQRQEDAESELVATGDSAMEGVDATSDLLGHLFQVPKDEADEVHRGHQS
jgi:hypothetical protein